MVALKQIEGQSVTVAFCPVAGLLATGTMAGALDASFDTASRLDVSSFLPLFSRRNHLVCLFVRLSPWPLFPRRARGP